MPLLVDTFNVLHVTGVLPPDLAGIDVLGLAELIQQSRFAREKVELICDGGTDPPPAPEAHGSVIIRYAGYKSSADALIGAMVRRIANPRAVTVVTADRAVQREARKRRCRVVTSAAFLQMLADDAHSSPGAHDGSEPTTTTKPSMSDAAVAGWLNAFGISEDEFDAVAFEAEAAADRLAPVGTADSALIDRSPDADREDVDLIDQDSASDSDDLLEAESVEQWMGVFGFSELVLAEIAGELGVELLPGSSPPIQGGGQTKEPATKPSTPDANPPSRKPVERQNLNEPPLPRDLITEAESLWSQPDRD